MQLGGQARDKSSVYNFVSAFQLHARGQIANVNTKWIYK